MTTTLCVPALLTIGEVAELLRVSKDSIYRLMREPGFPRAIRPRPGCTRFKAADVVAYLDKLSSAGAEDGAGE